MAHASGSPLLQLPDSILLTVFQNLSVELYALSLLNRRLHHLALPVFLHRHRIPSSAESIVLHLQHSAEDGQIDALSALRIALFVQSVTRLTCYITSTAEVPFFHMSRLKKFLSRISSVGEVDLVFSAQIADLDLANEFVGRDRWLAAFSRFRDVLIATKCERLVVRNGDDERVYLRCRDICTEVKDSKSGHPPRHAIWRRIHPGKRSTPILEEELRMGLALTSFSIHSASVLRHPHFRTTFSFSTLQSLSLTSPWTEAREWSVILSSIASVTASTLSQLSIRATYILPADIIKFLSHFQRLTTLTLILSLLDQKRHLCDHPKLPFLTTLTVPPNYMSSLLASRSALHNLQSIDIYLPSIVNLNSTAHLISKALRSFNKRHSGGSTLTIPFYDAFKSGMMADLDTSLGKAGKKYSLPLLERLTIVDFFLTFHATEAGNNDLLTFILPRWLALWFPNLKHLKFADGPKRSQNYLKRIYPFIHAIRTRCSNIQTVTFSSECFDVTPCLETPGMFQSSADVTQFLDLPDEILFLIFGYITSTDIYALSMLSRRLQLLALPSYLSRTNLPDQNGTWSTFVGHGDDDQQSLRDLSVVRRLPLESPMSLRALHVNIFSSGDIFIAFEYVQLLQSVIANVTSLQEVLLDFCLIVGLKKLSDRVFVKRWAKILRALVDAILRKTSASLRIIGTQYWGPWLNKSSKEVYIPGIAEVCLFCCVPDI
jgi:hypothetical protein